MPCIKSLLFPRGLLRLCGLIVKFPDILWVRFGPKHIAVIWPGWPGHAYFSMNSSRFGENLAPRRKCNIYRQHCSHEAWQTAQNYFPIQKLEKILRSEEHTSELQSQSNLVCRLLLEKNKRQRTSTDLSMTLGLKPHAVASRAHC